MSKLIKIGQITVNDSARSVLNDNRDYDVYADNSIIPPTLCIVDGPDSDALPLPDIDYDDVDYEWGEGK